MAVDPGEAVKRALKLDRSSLKFCSATFDISAREVYVVAIGKAASALANAVDEVLGGRVAEGVISGPSLPEMQALESRGWQTFSGGHPLPNQASLDAAQAAIKLLRRADEARAIVIFLISGGGSAMLEWPRDVRITLKDLRQANLVLVSSGATITEINAVRRAISAVKGGRLAMFASHTDQFTLIVSDTNPADEASVASGPTLAPPANAPDAWEVIKRYQLDSSFPPSVLAAIQSANAPETASYGNHHVILDNGTAIEAAASEARRLGFAVEIANDINEQAIGEGSSLLVSRLLELWWREGGGGRTVCLISGGEFSCPVRGDGLGGRNSETALRCAIEFRRRLLPAESPQHLVALSAGTDGIDGNSPAAGAIGDETTTLTGDSQGLDAESFLKNSDSFIFFNSLGDAIVTGSTGTNVRDLRILLASGADFCDSRLRRPRKVS